MTFTPDPSWIDVTDFGAPGDGTIGDRPESPEDTVTRMIERMKMEVQLELIRSPDPLPE